MAIVRSVVPGDIPDILPRLREADIQEWEAFAGVHPRMLLPLLAYDPNTYTIVTDDGVPVGLFGASPVEGTNGLIGTVWMIATPQLEDMQIEFLRKCRTVVTMLNDRYPILWNHVDCRNTVHLKWLEWCGFKFISRKEKWGAQSLPFYEIIRIKSQCA
ncbi:hypothetical protein HYPP_02630 [Hyphomicrobium sp. ghe19]|nr:hypothetical protein HYPP_02630 [Hyphomicrobium sp. ghe19]